MSFKRIDMRTLNKSDHADYVTLARRFTWCDKHIAFKYLKEIGILLTSHPGNRAFLKASVETHAQTKLWITLVYDNYFDPERKDVSWDHVMPSREVIDQVNAFIVGPYQKWGGVLYPYFWLLKLGLAAMDDFEYIYSANGDCIVEKPEKIFELLERMKQEDADFISSGWWDEEGARPVFNSTGFIGRTQAIREMMRHFSEGFIPLKAYESTCQEWGNCEGRMGRAIKDLDLKVVKLENPKNEQLHEKYYGDWCKILGFRHVHAEHNIWWRDKETRVPPELKYYDPKFISAQELEAVKRWWEKMQ